ncbi:MAG: tRNA (adenosine(37)-N6)-threonylcarbamoyltransferase complex ATPase subunit type 1 TsaE [Chloroflexi bacterium]|nr:tRNA (adenosine(37)-N6)-threonylcarbamoyltransferase complex ATPase subunit type 1 TsaE [Chloroflexota bacterium]
MQDAPWVGGSLFGLEGAKDGMPERVRVETHGEEETRQLGAHLSAAVRAGDVLLLLGHFGAGKTTLVQGIARGLGVDQPVTSPSFVIASEYQGRIPLYHIDLYRVEQMDEVTLEAIAEYFGGDGLCVVEWPGSVPDELAHGAVRLELAIMGEEDRGLTLEGALPRLQAVFERFGAGRLAQTGRHGG